MLARRLLNPSADNDALHGAAAGRRAWQLLACSGAACQELREVAAADVREKDCSSCSLQLLRASVTASADSGTQDSTAAAATVEIRLLDTAQLHIIRLCFQVCNFDALMSADPARGSADYLVLPGWTESEASYAVVPIRLNCCAKVAPIGVFQLRNKERVLDALSYRSCPSCSGRPLLLLITTESRLLLLTLPIEQRASAKIPFVSMKFDSGTSFLFSAVKLPISRQLAVLTVQSAYSNGFVSLINVNCGCHGDRESNSRLCLARRICIEGPVCGFHCLSWLGQESDYLVTMTTENDGKRFKITRHRIREQTTQVRIYNSPFLPRIHWWEQAWLRCHGDRAL
uniref:CNH domain-containing protein n=1 Tax=Macrostomum lignano TaxID=282301 RepID=A0A1I8HQG8_9PLAT